MPEVPKLPDAAELLRHRAWLRRLAFALTRDGHDAADVEQQTWLAALRSPPANEVSLRGWLATVARNVVRRASRGASRRAQRESRVSRHEAARPTAELAAESEVAARVARSVFALPEPQRSVILLRFYEGLTVRQVADRMGAPYETTRSRLRVAIGRLRSAMPAEADPLLALSMPLALHAASSTAPVPGVLIMTKLTKVAAASFALVAVGLGGVWAAADIVAPPPAPHETSEVAVTNDAEVARLRRRVAELEELVARRDVPRVRVERVERVESVVRPLSSGSESSSPSAPAGLAAAWRAQLFTDLTPQRPGRVDLTLALSQPKTEEPTPVDVSTLSDLELLEHARRSAKSKSTRPALLATREAWQELVDRQPAFATLDEAIFGLGIAHRNLGDHDVERATFDDLIELVGYDSDRGEAARYQRAWALFYGGDPFAAANEMEALADISNGMTDRARHALLNGAGFARGAKDPARARRMLTRLREAVDGDETSLARFFDGHASAQLSSMK